MNEVVLCKRCGKPVQEDYNFILDHTAGLYGEDKDPTRVREGVFCSRSCLTSWLQEAESARAQMSGRTVSILISEVGHDLDEIATGWSQKEDALIEVGINDARRDLEELRNLIVEVSG